MAPTSPAKRVTRARAAAKKADPSTNAVSSQLGKTKVTKSVPTRKAKPIVEEPHAEVAEQPKKAPARTTKTASLTAAPRRRIRVTPLDAAAAVEESAPEPPKGVSKTKKTAKRTKNTTAKEQKNAAEEAEIPPKTRSRTTKSAPKQTADKPEPAVKTRSRPKRAAAAEVEDAPEQNKVEAIPTTRQTRGRSASDAEAAADTITVGMKAKPATRKKVTFQGLPEDDKENQPVPTRKQTAKKETAPATGIRAKPLRKPAAAVTKKVAATSKSKATKAESRVLTPKKPIQVNRLSTPPSPEGEDELSGAKTPVRDLSMSPKRNPQLGARLSPIKRLDFTHTLKSQSPDRSPLKESPRRFEVPPVFPCTTEQPVSAAAPFGISSTSQSVLLQSPKRVVLDSAAFSQSAMKPQRSAFKNSLLQSPARRLFSPAKGKSPDKHLSPATPNEVAISSHFRSSVSPQRSGRVHRMSDEELGGELKDAVDFDQSILSVRSPLKVKTLESRMGLDADVPMADDNLTIVQEDDKQVSEDVTDIAGPDAYQVDTEKTKPSTDADSSINQDADQVHVDSTAENKSTITGSNVRAKAFAPRLSEVLFRSARCGDEDESSEDELAADMTPDRAPRLFRPSLTGAGARFRLSTVAPSNLSRDVGFTPLAAQVSGWQANSPMKIGVKKDQTESPFSPVAALHVDGEIQISRQSTPKQYRSPLLQSSSRRSGGSRISLAPSMGASPEKISFFDEQMVAQDADEQMEDVIDAARAEEELSGNQTEAAEDVFCAAEDGVAIAAEQEDAFASDSRDDTIVAAEGNSELTTDLVNFTNASETAMVDFAELANEADQLAPSDGEVQHSSPDASVYGDENAAPVESDAVVAEAHVVIENHHDEDGQQIDEAIVDHEVQVEGEAQSHSSPIFAHHQVAEAEPAIPTDIHITSSPTRAQESPDVLTPVRPDLSHPRFVNTVVSKVPLRPEGHISPVKIAKKRSRSLSTAGHHDSGSPVKRVQFTPVVNTKLPFTPTARSISDNVSNASPSRSVRSAAPSPAASTVGERSFAIEDFGDSTLDGIELPADEDEEMDFDVGMPTPNTDITTTTSAAIAATPLQLKMGTPTAMPSTVKSTTKTARTPSTSARDKCASLAAATAAIPSRTPLQPVTKGILSGAVVYVEVHTTEGADASGVYIDLLTQMGAKCLREWRWNPRASSGGQESACAKVPAGVGITHVVYKDGGKRTLEKVRDAGAGVEGGVWCVGVRWVLDCERSQSWLDETPYVVDHAILPRGGSRRRKSMQPRALVNEGGFVSASKGVVGGSRSISAEHMTEGMRRELVETPVRTYPPLSLPAGHDDDGHDESYGDRRGEGGERDSVMATLADEAGDEGESTEISSTYNSPTTTMNVRHAGIATPTELVGWDPANAMTPAPVRNAMQTPTMTKQGVDERDWLLKSAPPKQLNKGIFDHEDAEGENGNEQKGKENGKGKMKLKIDKNRRRTLGVPGGMWKPKVGSPLREVSR